MRYLMLLSGTNPATPPPPALFEAIMKLGGEATEAGVLLDTAGLLPSAAGARVGLADGPLSDEERHAARLIGSHLGMTAAQAHGVILMAEESAAAG